MTREAFYEALKDTLEMDDDAALNAETDLKTLPEYDSLAVLSIIALVHSKFGVKIPGAVFGTIDTVQSLMDAIGADKFED